VSFDFVSTQGAKGGAGAAGSRPADTARLVESLELELAGEKIDLPSFPDVAVRVRKALTNEEVEIEHVVRVVSAEPALAARLLQVANSAALNPNGKRLTDLRTAVSRIGFNMARSATIAFAMSQLRRAEAYKGLETPLTELWHYSAHVAAVCLVVAKRFTRVNPDTALLTGLLHGVGKLYLLTRAVKFPALLADPARYQPIVAEWHGRLAQAILRNWEMADEVVTAVSAAENLDREHVGAIDLADVLAVSSALAALGRRAPYATRRRFVWSRARGIARGDRLASPGARLMTTEVSTTISRALPNTVTFGFVKSLAGELSKGPVELPSVPEVVIRLQRALSDENASNDSVVKVLGAEPVLAAKLMNMANSAALNASGRMIADLRTAVARVGFNIVRSAALSFAVEQLRQSEAYKHLAPPLDALWNNSVEIAALSHVIARRFSSLNGDTALLTGLMHNVGRIYILTRASTFPALIADPLTFNSITRDWHANVARAVLENWRMPAEIVDAVGSYEDMDRELRGPVTLIDVLSLAVQLERNRQVPGGAPPDERLFKSLHRLQLLPKDVHAVLDESAEEIVALKSALGG
jgi:HD-like signal output (HDOD) protein